MVAFCCMFSQRLFFCQMERFPLLHPDLTHAHIYTHTHAHTCNSHTTYIIHPLRCAHTYSHILTLIHHLYHMHHTPAHMHSYTLIDTHTQHTLPHTYYTPYIPTQMHTYTHAPHVSYSSYPCSDTLICSHAHTHTTHHTHRLWIGGA